jgi:hypothetical protein
MWLFRILSPVAVFNKAVFCGKDVINYRFYRNRIKSLGITGELAEKGMRYDWLRRVYFVVNLLPETLLAGSDTESLERSRVTEAIAERNQVFMKDGLLELVVADYRRIKSEEYYAYLIWVKYRSLSSIGDWIHVILWISSLGIAVVNYQVALDAINYIKDLYFQINN